MSNQINELQDILNDIGGNSSKANIAKKFEI